MTIPDLAPAIPLVALRAFDVAAQKGSFAEAAAALGVSPSSISQLVKKLEQYFGAPLFARGNRKVTLTQQGKDLHTMIKVPFSMLSCAVDNMMVGRMHARAESEEGHV